VTALGTSIREARVRRGISQTELAERVGVSQSAVSFWENGVEPPRFENLLKLAQELPELAAAFDDHGLRLLRRTEALERQLLLERHRLDHYSREMGHLSDRLMVALSLLTDLETGYGWNRQSSQVQGTIGYDRRILASTLKLAAAQADYTDDATPADVIEEAITGSHLPYSHAMV
jgi:transcriptional regulator with XRE-family HTH domain